MNTELCWGSGGAGLCRPAAARWGVLPGPEQPCSFLSEPPSHPSLLLSSLPLPAALLCSPSIPELRSAAQIPFPAPQLRATNRMGEIAPCSAQPQSCKGLANSAGCCMSSTAGACEPFPPPRQCGGLCPAAPHHLVTPSGGTEHLLSLSPQNHFKTQSREAEMGASSLSFFTIQVPSSLSCLPRPFAFQAVGWRFLFQ